MKGDFTRLTHDPAKRFSKVREQQGRGLLDADFNEQVDIQAHRAELTAIDVIGQTGFPKGDAFQVEALADGTIQVHPGRAYVDGILCELPGENPIKYEDQPDLGPAFPEPVVGRRDLVYLDVWERHITAQQDPDIKEVALGGADTATRVQVVCQIRVQTEVPQALTCESEWTGPAAPSNGTMTTVLDVTGAGADLCSPLPSSSFRGLENRLYRVEIHQGGGLGAAKFKWSRDNGSVTFAVEENGFDGTDSVKLVRLGRDPMLSIAAEQWAEVIGDRSELVDGAGTFAQIDSVNASTRLVKFKSAVNTHSGETHPIVRRWDGPLQTVTAAEVELEDGIKVKFGGTTFRAGDYWIFTARTTGEGGLEILDEAPPHGVKHHYARLGIVKWVSKSGPNWNSTVDDCRKEQWFPPLTDITAEDVSFSSNVCKFGPEVDTVHKALEELCKQNKDGCAIEAVPGVGWEKVFDKVKAGVDASICFPVGEYPVTTAKPIVVKARHLKLVGAGAGTRIVAKAGECAVRFENCTSVTVRDLAAEAVLANPQGEARHLNGVLTFQSCSSVSLSGLHVRCASAATRAVSCVTINNKPAGNANDRALVSVENCEFRIGDQQVGLLVVNAQRATVRNNRMRVLEAPAAPQQFFQLKMQDKSARAAVTRAMVSGITLVDKEAEAKAKEKEKQKEAIVAPGGGGTGTPPAGGGATPSVGGGGTPTRGEQPKPGELLLKSNPRPSVLSRAPNVIVTVSDKHELRFHSDTRIAEAFKGTLRPEDLTPDPKRMSLNLQKAASRFVLEQNTAPQAIQAWLVAVARTTCASQGITIGGTEVLEAIVEDNTIIGAAQAIHVGVSHENPLKAKALVDRMDRVTVTGNHINVYAVVGYTRSRHAIFVGNADSVVVRENYARLTRFTGMEDQPIDGIRVFGYFGRYISVRENHLSAFQPTPQEPFSRFSVGILFQLRGALPSKKPMWHIKDNLAERSDTPVSANHAAMITEGNFA